MKAHEILSIPLGEKVYVTELYHDRSSDLVAVGLKNSVLIYQLNFDNEKPSSNMIKAVINFFKDVCRIKYNLSLIFVTDISRFDYTLFGMVS